MKIAVGCDHGGFGAKAELVAFMEELGHEVKDFGSFTSESVDYPDIVLPVCEAVGSRQCDRGVLLCGTGVGMSIAANKLPGIRCALCGEACSARLSRQHNDSNVLAMGSRVMGLELMKDVLSAWLEAAFVGGHHTPRLEKIRKIEERFFR